MTDTPELKPCPFCGSEASASFFDVGRQNTCCSNESCDASGVPFSIDAWNTRPIPEGKVLVDREWLESWRCPNNCDNGTIVHGAQEEPDGQVNWDTSQCQFCDERDQYLAHADTQVQQEDK